MGPSAMAGVWRMAEEDHLQVLGDGPLGHGGGLEDGGHALVVGLRGRKDAAREELEEQGPGCPHLVRALPLLPRDELGREPGEQFVVLPPGKGPRQGEDGTFDLSVEGHPYEEGVRQAQLVVLPSGKDPLHDQEGVVEGKGKTVAVAPRQDHAQGKAGDVLVAEQ